jgi:hypothetical protein
MRPTYSLIALAGLAVGIPAACGAQQQGTPLEVGVTAPDFSIPGATRYGILRDPVRLSDFRGKTVVLAFFYRARTPG